MGVGVGVGVARQGGGAWRGRGVTHLPMRGMARDVAGSLLEMSSRKTDCARSTEMAIDVFSPPGGSLVLAVISDPRGSRCWTLHCSFTTWGALINIMGYGARAPRLKSQL